MSVRNNRPSVCPSFHKQASDGHDSNTLYKKILHFSLCYFSRRKHLQPEMLRNKVRNVITLFFICLHRIGLVFGYFDEFIT